MRTYTEAQYSTPSAYRMIIEKFMGGRLDDDSAEAAAKYMRDTLRIGGIKACRALVEQARDWEADVSTGQVDAEVKP